MQKRNEKPSLLIRLGKLIKIKHIVLLILLLIANSYAWFIFSTKVRTNLTANVASWSIRFTDGENEFLSFMNFNVERIYPGMEEASETLYINNIGSEDAILSYEIDYIRIFDDIYQIDEEDEDNEITAEDLNQMAKNDFPFKFDFVYSSEVVGSVSGNETFTISLNWDYESGDDKADTTWGEAAYQYYATNPDKSAIEVKLKVYAVQQPKSEDEPEDPEG